MLLHSLIGLCSELPKLQGAAGCNQSFTTALEFIMSRAFVKEDDSGEAPIIPPRAALPPGTPNYVTPQGLDLLRRELQELEQQRSQASTNHEEEAERRRQLAIIQGRINALNQKIASAKVIDPRQQPTDEVRFGATVKLRSRVAKADRRPIRQAPGERTFTIVGVDEASVAEGRVAFVAPIARAVLGASLGQTVSLRLGRHEEELEVMEIDYEGAK